jgi:hypothetical protein
MQRKTIFLYIQGGIGDVLAATATVRCARKQYPEDEIIVLSTYTDVWKNNPNIDLVIALKDVDQIKDFYTEYFLTRDVRYFKKFFPYDHIYDTPAQGSKTLREFICKLYGFEFDGIDFPDYYITDYEKRAADTFLKQDSKPIILLHIYTAVPSENGVPQKIQCNQCLGKSDPKNPCPNCRGSGFLIVNRPHKTTFMKDLNPEIVAPVVAKLRDKYNFIQIGLEGEPLVPGAFDCLGMPMRDTVALIQHEQVKSFIFVESLFQHAAAAFRKSGVVVFQNTSPFFFGYTSAFNVWDSGGCKHWPCNRPCGTTLDLNPGYKNPKTREKSLWECPNQLCAKLSSDKLEQVFMESLEEKVVEEKKIGPVKTVEEARKL